VDWSGEKPTPTAKALESDDVVTLNSSSTGFGLGDLTGDHILSLKWSVRLGSVPEEENELPTSQAFEEDDAATADTVYSVSLPL
jgi:hypothetical protein